ncbi:MAG TPA: hypothetical protein VF628_05565 [Allosphingosinicella sp.]|jgi:hypothetical protein
MFTVLVILIALIALILLFGRAAIRGALGKGLMIVGCFAAIAIPSLWFVSSFGDDGFLYLILAITLLAGAGWIAIAHFEN